MLSINGGHARSCDGVTRRDLLRIGALSALGLGSPGLSRPAQGIQPDPRPGFGAARSCILIYLFGGPSQLDTFDMKPDAPAQFRGEFKPIASKIPGTLVCEHLPRLAHRTDKFSLIRSMNHEHPRHGWGLYYMLTGRKHSRPDLDAPPTPDDFPGYGAIVNHLGRNRPGVPSSVTLPRWNRFNDLPNDYAGERGGFLGNGDTPWLVDSSSDGLTFAPRALDLELGGGLDRLADRRAWLERVDRPLADWGENATAFDRVHRKAYELVTAPAVRRAFKLDDEKPPLRDAYGRDPFGQGLLLARRLVEAGVTMIQVNWHNDGSDVKSPFWDTHKKNFESLKDKLLPPLDIGLSALLDDLHNRGLLDSTLVVVMGEFGRTPRIGQIVMNGATDASGRDHWPHAYTVLVAGGGVRNGMIYGASDERAAHVVDSAVSPPDLQATVLHLLGIDARRTLTDRRGRSFAASDGRVIQGLLRG